MKMRTITCFDDRTNGTFLIIPSVTLSDEDNSVSRTDNFVIVNVFNSVASSRYQKSKLCKKRRTNNI